MALSISACFYVGQENTGYASLLVPMNSLNRPNGDWVIGYNNLEKVKKSPFCREQPRMPTSVSEVSNPIIFGSQAPLATFISSSVDDFSPAAILIDLSFQSTNAVLTHGLITFTIESASENFETGYDMVGQPYIVTNGELVVSATPGSATSTDGYIINGSQVNPVQGGQAYHEAAFDYDQAAGASSSVKLYPGDVLVKTIGLNIGTHPRNGLIEDMAILTVTNTAPAAGDVFGPSFMERETFHSVDLDAYVARLPSLSTSGHSPMPVKPLQARLDQFLPLFVQYEPNTAFAGYQLAQGRGVGSGRTESNYGQHLNATIGTAGLHLISDIATQAEKKALLASLIWIGKQIYDAYNSGVTPPGPNGGHFQFHALPVALYLDATGQEIDALMEVFPGNFAAYFQTSKISAYSIPHDDMTKPHTWRRRTLRPGSVNGLDIDLGFVRTGSTGDPAQVNLVGLLLTRASDGATALVTAMADGTAIGPNKTSMLTLKIDKQPMAAFAPGDIVYFTPPFSIPAVDWNINNILSSYNPSTRSVYRELNQNFSQIVTMLAIDILPSNMSEVATYLANAMRADFPNAKNDYPTHAAVVYNADRSIALMWDLEFYFDHGIDFFLHGD